MLPLTVNAVGGGLVRGEECLAERAMEVNRLDTLRSERQMERAIGSVVRSWAKRMAADPVYDIDDLAQELRIRYWLYQEKHAKPPLHLTLRSWAWDVMRQWGYRGSRSSQDGLLSSERIAREISFSRHPATMKHDVTDEEILDSLHYFPYGVRRKWNDHD